MITVQHIAKSFGAIQAVRDISFTLTPNSITGILGPNGAGKTTTLRILAGLEDADKGEIRIAGNLFTTETHKLRAKIGYLPETIPLFPQMGVLEFLNFMGQLQGLKGLELSKRLTAVIDMCQLQDVLQKKCATLSKGFRQRTGLAMALIHDPDILILDEPTEGLDPVQILEIRKLLQFLSQTKTILFSSHILSEITQLCQHILIVKSGQIVSQGNLADFGGSTENLEKTFMELFK